MNKSRGRSNSDLNRPLPKLPTEQDKSQRKDFPPRTSSTKDTVTPSIIEKLNSELSGIPMWSTSRLSKQQFDELSRDFALPTTPSLSLREREASTSLDPVKFSPSNTHQKSSMFQSSSPMFLKYALLFHCPDNLQLTFVLGVPHFKTSIPSVRRNAIHA